MGKTEPTTTGDEKMIKHTNDAILAANQKTAIQMIKDNLATSDKWVVRAILVIYSNQTANEQCTETTREENGIGFNGTDAQILSSFAKQIIEFEAGRTRFMTPLSRNQMGLARAKITKYAGQLLKAAKVKAATKAAAEAQGWDVLLTN
jgi:hypothetical protein